MREYNYKLMVKETNILILMELGMIENSLSLDNLNCS